MAYCVPGGFRTHPQSLGMNKILCQIPTTMSCLGVCCHCIPGGRRIPDWSALFDSRKECADRRFLPVFRGHVWAPQDNRANATLTTRHRPTLGLNPTQPNPTRYRVRVGWVDTPLRFLT